MEGDEDIVFDDVTFSYKEDVPVLTGVNCTIRKGRVTAIIGTNGAGKTIMLKLLERMYEPSRGTIKFGDTDISEYSLESWRKNIARSKNFIPSFTYPIQRAFHNKKFLFF